MSSAISVFSPHPWPFRAKSHRKCFVTWQLHNLVRICLVAEKTAFTDFMCHAELASCCSGRGRWAQEHPARVKRMADAWQAWLNDCKR